MRVEGQDARARRSAKALETFNARGSALARRRLSVVPDAWRDRVESLHSEKSAESFKAGNLWLLDTVERIEGLRVPIGASDAEIIALSERCAFEAMALAPLPLATLEAARARMARLCGRYRVTVPEPLRQTKSGSWVGVGDAQAVKRMTCPLWWRKGLRKAQARALEGEAVTLGYVHRRGEIYASDATVERRGQQRRRNAATLEGMTAQNVDTGEEFKLSELAARSVANPAIRRGELMTRIAGFEGIAQGVGDAAEFVTVTCPSRFHAKKIGAGGAPMNNHKYDGSTPRDAQQYLTRLWASIRAKLHRLGVRPYGFRIAEPHHDATPHWHMLLFVAGAAVAALRQVIAEYALRDSGDEPGAQKNRVKFVAIDASKGTAAGYIAKYVSKNIDGYQVQADLEGDNLQAVTSAPRVEAWASTWGIRQFQQIGGPPVGVWRELRRIRNESMEHGEDMARARSAADAGNWRSFVEIMGGPVVRRGDLPLRVARVSRYEFAGRLRGKRGQYDEVGLEVFGVLEVAENRAHLSRFHRWEMRRGGGGVGVGLCPSRTRVNNCTVQPGGGQELSEAQPIPWGAGVDFSRFTSPRESDLEKVTRLSWEGWENVRGEGGGAGHGAGGI